MTLYLFADERIDCRLDLPLTVSAADVPADVEVAVRSADTLESPRFTTLLHRGDLDGAPWALGVLADGNGWGAVLGTGCIAHISADARRVDVTSLHGAPDDWLAEAIVGWALVYRLAILGRPSFHASAATLDGQRAVAICGPTHSGKSTMAAAALALGGSLLADDVFVPDVTDDAIVVPSTASAMKLRGSARALGDEASGDVTFDDRLRLTDDEPSTSLPLSHVVFLDPAADSQLRALPSDEVVVRLLAESKVGTWSWDDARAREFDIACEVARRVPGYVVGRSSEAPSRSALIAACSRLFSA
jgi:hypothetical protein